MSQALCQTRKSFRVKYLNKKPRSEDRGTFAERATIAGREPPDQVAEGAAGWNTMPKPSMQ
jgi:hypothetical protein